MSNIIFNKYFNVLHGSFRYHDKIVHNFGTIKFEPQKLYNDVMKAINIMIKQFIILAL